MRKRKKEVRFPPLCFLIIFYYAILSFVSDNRFYAQKKFRVSHRKKDTRHAKSIFSAYTLGPSGVYATSRPHQMPRGNATSHEYRTDIRCFTREQTCRTTSYQNCTAVAAGVEITIIDPHQ